jgi:hypothetical protein
MAVALRVRGQLKGAMVFASALHTYDQNDLRFAELYTQQIGAALEKRAPLRASASRHRGPRRVPVVGVARAAHPDHDASPCPRMRYRDRPWSRWRK